MLHINSTKQIFLLGTIFLPKIKPEVSSIRKKQYDLVIPEQQESSAKDIEHALKNAVLLSLLENKYITMWQYEQCCTKLHLSEIDKLPL